MYQWIMKRIRKGLGRYRVGVLEFSITDLKRRIDEEQTAIREYESKISGLEYRLSQPEPVGGFSMDNSNDDGFPSHEDLKGFIAGYIANIDSATEKKAFLEEELHLHEDKLRLLREGATDNKKSA